jgi:polyribonucleotide nucleotidyltransferase
MAVTIVEREIGGRMMRLETGRVAKLASGAVMASYADSTVMAACVRSKPRQGIDFFPLQCDYREKLTASGKFPGGFRKREGAPNEKEVLTMRMMDRPIRPLFPDGFIDEIQIQAWVMSHDGQNDTDVLACTAGSAAVCLTDAPFNGPVATVRVGRIMTDDGETFVLNPTVSQMEYSDLDLVLSGHPNGINMIEVGAAEVEDDVVLEAIRFGLEEGIKPIIELVLELCEKSGAPEANPGPLQLPAEDVMQAVKDKVYDRLVEARKIHGKQERNDAVGELREEVLHECFALPQDAPYAEYKTAETRRGQAKDAFRTLEKKITHMLVAEHGIRADGRGLKEIRAIEMEPGIFSRTHGSAFFQRGETQSLVTCALGTNKAEQIVDGLLPEYAKKFYLHYNFPPFCVGEAGRIMGPGRREVGHGALAERSLLGVIPSTDDFPYTIRLVSDITESNGSSSMASVCGGCLALMDAGVPIRNTCAGISVGRFTSAAGKVSHVTDILGEEDFFGEMDFKVSGTREGITGIQLDLKALGLEVDEIGVIFEQAKEGRMQIIDQMESVLAAPREDISRYAPRIITVKIDPDKIGKLIGPGGKTIRGIQERTGCSIDVEEDGTVLIGSTDAGMGEQCKAEVEALGAEIRVGTIYEGKVVSVKDFGAFIELAPGTDGMCHISELDHGFVKSVGDVVSIGDTVKVKVINVDDTGRIKLSRRALIEAPEGTEADGDDGGQSRGGGGRGRRHHDA